MATQDVILQELARDNLLYGSKRGTETLEQAAEVWAETLGDMSNVAYVKAHIQARKVCQFPPTPADVIAAYRDQGARPLAGHKSLPQRPLTRPETAKRHIANLRAMAHDEPMPYVDEALDANPEAFEHYHARISR